MPAASPSKLVLRSPRLTAATVHKQHHPSILLDSPIVLSEAGTHPRHRDHEASPTSSDKLCPTSAPRPCPRLQSCTPKPTTSVPRSQLHRPPDTDTAPPAASDRHHLELLRRLRRRLDSGAQTSLSPKQHQSSAGTVAFSATTADRATLYPPVPVHNVSPSPRHLLQTATPQLPRQHQLPSMSACRQPSCKSRPHQRSTMLRRLDLRPTTIPMPPSTATAGSSPSSPFYASSSGCTTSPSSSPPPSRPTFLDPSPPRRHQPAPLAPIRGAEAEGTNDSPAGGE